MRVTTLCLLTSAVALCADPEDEIPNVVRNSAVSWLQKKYGDEKKPAEARVKAAKDTIKSKGYSAANTKALKEAETRLAEVKKDPIKWIKYNWYLVDPDGEVIDPGYLRVTMVGPAKEGGSIVECRRIRMSVSGSFTGNPGSSNGSVSSPEPVSMVLTIPGLPPIKEGKEVRLAGFYFVSSRKKVGDVQHLTLVPFELKGTELPEP